MADFYCDKCDKKVSKRGEDWNFVNMNPKDLIGNILAQDMSLILRICNDCKEVA